MLLLVGFLFSCSQSDNGSFSDSDIGFSDTKSGSYATMLTIGTKLYVVNKTQITTYDVSRPAQPFIIDNKDVGVDIESLYYYNGLLLIGSAGNMYIYRINDDGIPEREGVTDYNNFLDSEVCFSDPIVVRNGLAYVTLSVINRNCSRFNIESQLRVYDITDSQNAKLLNTVTMSFPRGLGLGKNHLYVCSKDQGLVVFNIDDPIHPIQVNTVGGFSGYDLIVDDDLLIVVGEKELKQFDISDEANPRKLSTISL